MIEIKDLDKRIKELKKSSTPKKNHKIIKENPAVVVCSELFSAVIIGLILGYYIDKYLGTKPVALIICLIIGCASGMLAIYKYIKK
jgi:ATP synthase protein I